MRSTCYQLYYVLRIACAMCFIGHGIFGIITKQIWCNYFGVFGISESASYQFMPFIGVMDILFGLTLILYPLRIVAGWLIVWGFFTALLRPLSGEPFPEFLERAGNYGAPFALILLAGLQGFGIKDWFKKIIPPEILDEHRRNYVVKCLQAAGFTLLLGHGWLNLMEKEGLLNQYAALGFDNPAHVAYTVGLLEMAGAVFILFKPFRQIVLVFFIWKMASELFYPAYGLFEWIERGGSYGILLALWIALKDYNLQKSKLISHEVQNMVPV